MKRIFVSLSGGLGNQMFQYAAGRALALRTGAELVLDGWSGFVRDKVYRRQYELDRLPVRGRLATPWERLPIWLYRTDARLRGMRSGAVQRLPYGLFLVECAAAYLPEMAAFNASQSAWLVGYWQSPRYFEDCADLLKTELMPPNPSDQKFLDLGETLRGTESVALGIRLYEESPNPEAHAREGRVKQVREVCAAIERLKAKCAEAKFFVFCTHRSPTLEELELPEDSVFVTHDDGYEGSTARLWLLSQCKHHIFFNSSYYWWGAWLSSAIRPPDGSSQHILAADNFLNTDGLCAEWETF